MRSYRVNVRGGAGAIALGIAVVVIGTVVVVSGLALLIGVALIAALLVGGAITLRKIFGQPHSRAPHRPGNRGFDPSLEVFPTEMQDARPPEQLQSPVRPSTHDLRGE